MPSWFGWALAAGALLLAGLYYWLTLERAQVLKMLAASFFPLAILILAVLGSIVFGLATPAEAAAAGAAGGFILAALYALARQPRARRAAAPCALVAAAGGGRWPSSAAAWRFDWYPPGWAITAAWLAIARLAVLAYWQLGMPRLRERSGVPDREDERHGVLAVRRLVDLLRRVRAARRPGAGRAAGCCRSSSRRCSSWCSRRS